jgi:hypothetical protein
MEDPFEGEGARARGLTGAVFDKMVEGDGAVRVTYGAVANSQAQKGQDDFWVRSARLRRAFYRTAA